MVKYNILVGKTKNEVIKELGQEFNYYPDNYLFYDIKRGWLENKTALLWIFGKDRRVKTMSIKTYFFLSSMARV
ncbi:hypothetical protein HZQ75_02025 [Elizabethkingia anophelis]|uniref:Uncharacterized protein n=1 Tax=Elizabethkingia anophelis R26 TaxID=1246994 RepID=A0ABN5BPR7_9FLAO|nr:hypothetical protein [Elizabethkingia anophelis]ATC35805.1 hypothetical protein BAZ09_006045 [Elizabethkingia anophelis R26]ATC39443.1 hypothetical protein EAAG1_006045 [Elizabethkingia anophelis Ag1]ATC43122.1 hypothetical protein CMV41_06045 [Elizabethkingia anophelis]ATC46798.1 hypothetical protein CMV40_06045 [Elizabethkingia anophelis]ELR79497.1 hypothetical protein D505_09983 [Elizabethkingia anophelis R26]